MVWYYVYILFLMYTYIMFSLVHLPFFVLPKTICRGSKYWKQRMHMMYASSEGVPPRTPAYSQVCTWNMWLGIILFLLWCASFLNYLARMFLTIGERGIKSNREVTKRRDYNPIFERIAHIFHFKSLFQHLTKTPLTSIPKLQNLKKPLCFILEFSSIRGTHKWCQKKQRISR